MLRFLLLLAVVGALGFAPAPLRKPSSPKEDLKRLQGPWVRVSLTIDGRPRGDWPGGCPITITGDRLQFPSPQDAWLITLVAGKGPKLIDYKGATKSAETIIFRGVYRLEGDTLTICVRRDGAEKDRPTDFNGAKEGVWLQVFKRKKP